MQALRKLETVQQSRIPPSWLSWIAENKLLKTEDSAIIEVLVANGFEKRDAEQQVQCAAHDPFLQGARSLMQRLHKIESLMNIYSDARAASAIPGTIERRSRLSRAEFLHSYYSVNRPVILRDHMKDWKSLTTWSPQYFKKRFGDEEVEIMSDRNSDPQYELNSQNHKRKTTLGKFVDLVTSVGETNDQYMVANNKTLQTGKLKELLSDIVPFPEFLDPKRLSGNAFLWFGPAGTVTPLHHDTMNILIAQVYGRKRFILIPSFQTHLIYNRVGVFSDVDCEAPDYERYPLFRDVQKIELELEPGEVLFIPVGWWHHVRSLAISISVSFINFVFPNNYQWRHPHQNC